MDKRGLVKTQYLEIDRLKTKQKNEQKSDGKKCWNVT